MTSSSRTLLLRGLSIAGALFVIPACQVSSRAKPTLRVCSDPNNLPFSNQKQQGYENRIAEILARDLEMNLEYVWWAQRRGFFRNTINAGQCDVVIGVPKQLELVDTTEPYYRSSYVFVQRENENPIIRSFDDPRLRRLTIGVQLIGDDAANAPPAHALEKRGIVDNVRGFSVYGDYGHEHPQAPIVRAVERGEVDIAIVWGPLAGYYAQRSQHRLRLTAVKPASDGELPLTFAISAGVRRGNAGLKARIGRALYRRRVEIQSVLANYGVPLVSEVR